MQEITLGVALFTAIVLVLVMVILVESASSEQGAT